MTQDEVDHLLYELASENYRNHARLIGLVQLLIDRKVLKGTDEEILGDIDVRAEQIEREEKAEARIKARVQAIREAWDKLPKQ